VRKALPALLLIAATAAVGLAAEAAVRWLRPGFVAGPDPSGNPFWRYDPELGWANREGEKGIFSRPEFSTHVSINAMGFRDPERSPGDAGGPGEGRDPFRIAVFGDSFTWGHGVEDDEVFTRLLERDLRGPEVWNLAVSGYATDQELLTFRKTAPLVRPKLVLVMVSRNDFTGNTQTLSLGYAKPRFVPAGDRLALEGSPVPRTPAWARALRWMRVRSALVNGVAALVEGDASAEGGEPEAGRDEEIRITLALLDAFAAESATAGARLAVGLVPSTAHVYTQSIPPIEKRRFDAIRSWGSERGVAVLDLVGPFRDEFESAGTRLHYPRDRHWNAAGHRLAARAIRRMLEAASPPLL